MEVQVNQRPVSVQLTCDECDHEHEKTFDDFCLEHGSPPDWNGQNWKCTECGNVNLIDGQSWD